MLGMRTAPTGSRLPVISRRTRRAAAICAASLAVLVAAGCGSTASHPVLGVDHIRVTSLSLIPTTGFPGPPTEVVVVHGGAKLAALVHLVPKTLPARLVHPHGGLTVCFPMDLEIGLSDGSTLRYPSCERPHSLLRLIAAMCPLLDKPGFCASERRELG